MPVRLAAIVPCSNSDKGKSRFRVALSALLLTTRPAGYQKIETAANESAPRRVAHHQQLPTDIRDEDDRLVITRAGLQAFADTLTTMPISLPALPDTIPMWPVRAQ